MRKLLFTILTIAFAVSVNAEGLNGLPSPKKTAGGSDFDQGNIIFSFGYGAPNFPKNLTYFTSAAYNVISTKSLGPIHAKFEYAMSNRFGVGISINYVSAGLKTNYDSLGSTYEAGFDYSSLAFNIRFNWHFYTENSLDLYTGGGLGYRAQNLTVYDANNSTKVPVLLPLGLEFSVGARYFFTDFLGAYVEIGATKSIIQGGLVVRL